MVRVVDGLPELLGDGDTMLLYLPLAHNFGRLMHLEAPYSGYTLAFCRDPLEIAEALLAVRPTVFPSVPRVYEKVHAAAVAQLEAARGPRRRLCEWALRVGREASRLRQEGKSLPPGLALRHRIADRLVFSKVKNRLGGRLRLAISGGAPLAREILEFFHALDLLVLEGYGLTECTTACSLNLPERYRFGTVGPLLPGFEARFDEDGELLIRSETVFAGYYHEEEATREVLDGEGWLRTGDIGRIDEEGFLSITDRKKDILVTAGGKNVAPQNLENELKSSKYVSQALVVGDRRPYVAALITLDQAEIARWGGEDVGALIQSVVDDINRDHSRFEQIKRFEILPRDFSAEEGEVTPTLKLKRRVVQEHFADAIERLYV
jgi:long-chain acyl-CoA synthetase